MGGYWRRRTQGTGTLMHFYSLRARVRIAPQGVTKRIWFPAALIVAILLFAPGITAIAQDREIEALPGQWVTFTARDGLPDDQVLAVWGAPDGTLWAGTEGGVASFDGVAWQAFADDTPALDGAVRAVWGRSSQDVWAAGDAGLAHFDGRGWQRIPAERLGLPEGPLYTIWGNESDDDLWVGGQGGAAYFDGETWRPLTPQNSELPNGAVHALAVDSDNRFIWFGTEAGLVRYEAQSDSWLKLAPDTSDSTTLSVLCLRLTDESLWVGTWSGLWRYDLVVDQWVQVDGSHWDGPDIVTNIWTTNGELWLAVSAPGFMLADGFQLLKRRSHGGLRRFDGRRWQQHWLPGGGHEQDPYDLGGDDVRAIWSDGEGIFWFATGKGLWRFDDERWQTYFSDSPAGQRVDVVRGDAAGHIWLGGLETLYTWQDEHWLRDLPPDWSQPLIQTVWVGSPDDLWLGSRRNGAAYWNGLRWERFAIEHGLASNSVNAIWVDGPKDAWLGTSEGLSYLDRMTGQLQTLTSANSDLPGDWVSALWSDGQVLWVGTLGGGAARYDPALGRWEMFQTAGLVDNDVKALVPDAAGGIWVATSGGVSHYDETSDSWQQWRAADILSRFDEPRALAVAPDGTAWLSGADLGVYYYTPEADSWQLLAPGWLDSTVDRIWASPDGTLWFATMGGAIHYDPQTGDGQKFTTRDGLVSDDVRAVWGDRAGTLWFATNAGVNRLTDGRWQTFTEADGLAGTNTLLLAGDDSGNVWAAGLNGISRYIGDGWEEVLSWPSPPALWRDLYAAGQGRFWVVAPDGTLHYFDGKNWALAAVADGQLTGLLQAVVERPQGGLWVGSQQGLAQRSAEGGSWSIITTGGLIDNEVNAIWGDGKRYIWFATSQGISRYDVASDTWQNFTTVDGLWSNNVTDLWGNDQGHVWAAQDEVMGQSEGGVSVFDDQRWEPLPLEGLPSRQVNSVWVDENGAVWAATTVGPAWWDGTQWQPPPTSPGVIGEVGALWAAPDGLWVVTEGGINHFDGNRWRTFTTADGLPAGELRAVWSNGEGEAWAGGSGGIAHFDGGRWQQFPLEAVPGEVVDLWGRSVNELWAATGTGVVHFDGTRWELVLAEEGATALVGDGQNGLWLGASRGLRHFDGQVWEQVAEENLPQVPVTDIWQAPDGTTWVSTIEGIYGFGGPEPPLRLLGGAVRALLVDRAGTLWFAEEDGEVHRVDQIPPVRIFSSDVLAMAEDARGDIWFGTSEGLLRYRARPPSADILSVELASGQPVQMVGREITLPYSPDTLTITLIATDTASLSSEMSFWYRLDPRENNWKRWDSFPMTPSPDKRRQISYDGLESGKNYTFYFAVYNTTNDTVGRQAWTIAVSPEPLWVRVRQHPAFPWALGASGLLLVTTGGAGLRIWQSRRAYGYRDVELETKTVTEETYQVTWQEPRLPPTSYPTNLKHSLVDPYLEPLEREVPPTEKELRQLGQLLFDALWNDATRQKLLQGTRPGRKGWRLRLNLAGTPGLLALPWELAYGGERLEFLGLSPDTALVRYLPPAEPLKRPKTKWPLEVVVVWAEPRDLPPVQAEQEVQALQAALRPLEQKGRLQLRVVPHATLEAFSRAVSEAADVIHFIGHGALEAGQGVLYFEDEYGDSIPLEENELATTFRGFQAFGDKAPKLVVLSACHSGATVAGGKALAGLAPALLQQGRVPAAIGMQFPVGAEVAASFADHFYHALVSRGGGQVDYAISVARKALFAEFGAGRRDWATPVLYMQVTDGRIFEVI